MTHAVPETMEPQTASDTNNLRLLQANLTKETFKAGAPITETSKMVREDRHPFQELFDQDAALGVLSRVPDCSYVKV